MVPPLEKLSVRVTLLSEERLRNPSDLGLAPLAEGRERRGADLVVVGEKPVDDRVVVEAQVSEQRDRPLERRQRHGPLPLDGLTPVRGVLEVSRDEEVGGDALDGVLAAAHRDDDPVVQHAANLGDVGPEELGDVREREPLPRAGGVSHGSTVVVCEASTITR